MARVTLVEALLEEMANDPRYEHVNVSQGATRYTIQHEPSGAFEQLPVDASVLQILDAVNRVKDLAVDKPGWHVTVRRTVEEVATVHVQGSDQGEAAAQAKALVHTFWKPLTFSEPEVCNIRPED